MKLIGEELLKRIKDRKYIYGSAIVSTSPLWVSAVKNLGLDFVFLDTEHMPLGRDILAWMCQAYRAAEIAPIVRIPSPDPFEAYKALDGGAQGIIAPYIEHSEQVQQLVAAVKLRPLKGDRLKRVVQKPETLEPELKKYLNDWNKGNILIINIESVPALENLDAILTVPGLDAVIIGPHDLSCSLGLPEQYNHPVFEQAVEEIIVKSRDRGLSVGIHFSEATDVQIKWAKKGVNIILHSSDIALFSRALRKDFSEIRQALNDKDEKTTDGSDFVV